MDALRLLEDLAPSTPAENFDQDAWLDSCYTAMNDDFNSPILIAQLFEAAKQIQAAHAGQQTLSKNRSIPFLKGCAGLSLMC